MASVGHSEFRAAQLKKGLKRFYQTVTKILRRYLMRSSPPSSRGSRPSGHPREAIVVHAGLPFSERPHGLTVFCRGTLLPRAIGMPLTAANVRLRPAIAADIPELHRLIELSVRRLQASDYTPAQIEGALGHALGLDTQLVADGTYFVAELATADGSPQIVGCGGWSNRRTLFGSDGGPNRQSELLDPKTDAAKIRAIFVHPDFARLGLGTLILKHCEEAAASAGFTRLEMGSTLTGVPLYKLKGYEEREAINIPLPNGEVLPVVKMTKELADPGSKLPPD